MTSNKPPLDSDLNIRVLAGLTAVLLVIVALAFVLMWWLSHRMLDERIAADPPPPALPEARLPHQPPEPRLQSEPFAELAVLRAAEENVLTTYGWVDESERLYSERLADLLSRARTRLAFFNALESSQWAFMEPMVRAGIPLLIGMHGATLIPPAIELPPSPEIKPAPVEVVAETLLPAASGKTMRPKDLDYGIQDLRKAVVWSEILAPPLALRDE